MKILVKFPTKGRKNKFLNTLKKYYQLCDNIDNLQFLLTIDEDDLEMNSPDTIEILNSFQNLKFVIGNSVSKIDAINRDININEGWDIILLASDDMIPQIKGYDTIILNKMSQYYPNTDGVLWFNDGFQGNRLNTLCILGKKYYERFNYIYYPDYKSTWCDNEFMDVANILGKQTYFEEVIIKHEHPDWGYGGRDLIHSQNNRNLIFDKNLYDQRKLINFNL
jgi:hypothetical protein